MTDKEYNELLIKVALSCNITYNDVREGWVRYYEGVGRGGIDPDEGSILDVLVGTQLEYARKFMDLLLEDGYIEVKNDE